MKNKNIILKLTVFLIVVTSILSGCSKSEYDIKAGTYVANEGFAHLTIKEDKSFILFRSAATSYAPTGRYNIDGDKLVLNVGDLLEKSTIVFKINGDKLIFESGKLAQGLIRKGTEFVYRDFK